MILIGHHIFDNDVIQLILGVNGPEKMLTQQVVESDV